MDLLNDFFRNFFGKENNPDKSLDDVEKTIKEQANNNIKITEYIENGMKVVREEYSSEDGKIFWSKTNYTQLPDESSELLELKNELAKAIENQEFEKAAELRDKIKEKSDKT